MFYEILALHVSHSKNYACTKNIDFCLPVENFTIHDSESIVANCNETLKIFFKMKRFYNSSTYETTFGYLFPNGHLVSHLSNKLDCRRTKTLVLFLNILF